MRVATLDEQGVATAFVLPTLALGVEELLRDDPVALHGVFRSFNQWLDEDWGFARDDRIIAPAMISLVDADAAEKDLAWAIEHGARAICLRPGPIVGPRESRSPGDPVYDSVWAMAAEASVLVTFHASDSGYSRYGADFGEGGGFQGYKDSPFTRDRLVAHPTADLRHSRGLGGPRCLRPASHAARGHDRARVGLGGRAGAPTGVRLRQGAADVQARSG